MLLLILRHGIAEEHAPGGDSRRALTEEGKSKLADVLKRAARADVKPGLILTSPYVRAVETAELAARILDCPAPPQRTEALVPSGSPQAVWNEVRGHRSTEQVLLAGHEPLLSQTVSYLLNAPTLKVDMKKACLVAIEFENLRGEPAGVLKWMLTAKLCS